MTVGEKIKQIRESRGLLQEELAKKANVSRTYIIQLENNRSSKPSAKVLFDIAEALDTTIADLLGKVPKSSNEDLELTPGMKAAIEKFPQLQEVQDQMPTWKYRGKYPATPEGWFAIYSILKDGKKEDND